MRFVDLIEHLAATEGHMSSEPESGICLVRAPRRVREPYVRSNAVSVRDQERVAQAQDRGPRRRGAWGSAGLRFGLLAAAILTACGDAADETNDGIFGGTPPAYDAATQVDSSAAVVGDAALRADASSSAPQSDAGSTSPAPDAGTGSRDAGSPALDSSVQTDDAAGPSTDASVADAAADAQSSPDARANDAALPPSDAGTKPRIKFVGNITTNGQVRSDFATFWNQITPENEGKWSSVEGTRNRMDWSGLDRARDYAKQHGVIFKQHTFVWGSQQPSWIGGLAPAQQRAEVEEWIRLFCERYPDVELIDVVNEPPPHTTPPYAQAIGGAGASGWDWIVQAFRWAHQYCPNAILILNDYNNIEYADQNAHFIDIAKRVKAAGAPIHAVGAQAHDVRKLSTSAVKGMLDKLASETGLPVYITEYDIDEADNTRQKQIMESQFTMFWNHPSVKGITLWGYVQGATWQQNSGLMSASGQQRPAMVWLLDFLRTR